MIKLSTLVYTLLIAAAAVAAPTANEDFVISEDAQTYTNAVNAAKAYTDRRIGEMPGADFTTSNATLVATIEATAPAPGNYAVVSNAAMTALQSYTETDPTVPAWAKASSKPSYSAADVGAVSLNGGRLNRGAGLSFGVAGNGLDIDMGGIEISDEDDGWNESLYIDYNSITHSSPNGVRTYTFPLSASDVGAVPTTRKINGQPLTNDITIASGVTSVNAKTGTVTLAASDVGAYSSAAGNTLAGQVATIGAHLNAEDARFVVTNYNSTTHTPEAYVEIKLPDDSWSLIWSEMTRWNWLYDYFLPTNYYDKAAVNAALENKADRAWGFYDSTTGEYAPDGYTWISSEKIAIAANLAYQRTVTTEGAIWVLESNGTVTETGGLTNGFFRISDDEGNSLFEIVKGSKRTIGADASSCQIVSGFTPTKLQIGYSVVSDVHPTLYVCQSLATQNWKAETDSDCLANVSWSGTSGAYVAQVQGKSAYSSLFVKATYEVGGETYINNSAPVSMQYIMLNGVKYSVGTATISGNTVLTLTVAP